MIKLGRSHLLLLVLLLAACAAPLQPSPTMPGLESPPASTPTVEAPPATQTAAPTQFPLPYPTRVSPPPQNVILIIVDTLRADHLPTYGYARPTTPNLDEWIASQGVRFERVVSTASWTCPSVAAMMSGRNPSSLGVNFTSMHLQPQANTLAETLQAAGYTTAGFATTYCVKGRLGFSQGFDLYDDSLSDRPASNKALAAEVNALAMRWLQDTWLPRSSGKPLFLMLYYFDPHAYYQAPAPFDSLYDPTYTGTLTAELYKDGEDVLAGKIAPSPRDIEHLKALYDGEITYWDKQLGEMMAFLQAQHLLDNALVVLTSDHGEMFGEHGKWTHGNNVYEEALRVPLFMRYTGVIPAGRSSAAPAQNYDLMPTILDYAGIPLPGDIQAVSLRAQAQGAAGDPQRPLFSEVDALNDKSSVLYWIAPRLSARSIEVGDWKLIRHVGKPDQDELYSLNAAAPYETENLLSAQRDLAQQLLTTLLSWFGIAD